MTPVVNPNCFETLLIPLLPPSTKSFCGHAFYLKIWSERKIVFLLFSKHDLMCLEITLPTKICKKINLNHYCGLQGKVQYWVFWTIPRSPQIFILYAVWCLRGHCSSDSGTSWGTGFYVHAGSPGMTWSLAFLTLPVSSEFTSLDTVREQCAYIVYL